MSKICTLLVSGLVSVSANTLAQHLEPAQVRAIEQVYESVVTNHNLVGLQAVTYDSGKIVSNLNLGYADLEHSVPVTDRTRFEIASITKAFTGLALHKLAEAGRIDLQADVRRYVPEFPAKEKGTITIDHLSGSLSGIRHYQSERDPVFYATHYDDVIDALVLFKDDPLVVNPGAKGHYTSYGYNLLAAAMQRASGIKFQHYVQQTILDPLKLHDTGFIDVRLPLQHRSRTYSFIDIYSRESMDTMHIVPTLEHSYNAGGGNMYSSAKDLTTFAQQFLKPGFVSETTLAAINTPHIGADNKPTLVSDGWAIAAFPIKEKHLVASGSYPGTLATIILFQEKEIILTFLTNTWPKDTAQVQRDLIEGLLTAAAGTPQ
jgi:CubicO group peptidase (beta-lactamase class C family)